MCHVSQYCPLQDGVILDVGSSEDIKKYITDRKDSYGYETRVFSNQHFVAPVREEGIDEGREIEEEKQGEQRVRRVG